MFSAELERKRGVKTTLYREPGWKPSVHELCPALPLPLSLHSPAPAPAGISCSLPMAPSQPHPAEGSNKSLQMWAELIKHTSDVFAFIWQLFSGTTRFLSWKTKVCPNLWSVPKFSEFREYLFWTKPSGILCVVPRKSLCCGSVHFLSWTKPL